MTGRLLCAWLATCVACSGGADPGPGFDGARAFRDLRDQVAIGPRPAGSVASRQTRQLIRQRLRQAGWRVEEQRFQAHPPGRPSLELVNLLATRAGGRRERILLAAHYDTKALPGVRFVGANDGASGVAVLLELARQLATRERELTLTLIFFDGEEAFGPNISADDGLYGSRALAERMARDGTLGLVRAMILVDMVADADLNLTPDTRSSPLLRRLLREEAGRLGLEHVIDRRGIPILDDHSPFLERGLEHAIVLIDFQFGARRTPGPLWHTAGDDLAAVSAESLNTSGLLAVRLLERVERDLLSE